MSIRPQLDFGAGESAEPVQDVSPEQPAADNLTPPAAATKPARVRKPKAPAAPPADPVAPPAKAAVICQRCQVACEPVPKSRNWVKCPKCGWKHKTFDKLVEAKKALRARQDKSAR